MTEEFFPVHTSMTNTVEDSSVDVYVNTTRICSNMSNAEFRALVIKLRDEAVRLIDLRMIGLATVWTRERDRVQTWFGKADEETRQTLLHGLPRLQVAMKELQPQKIVRFDDDLNIHLSCTPAPVDPNVAASVCKPDSSKRIVAIYPSFCTLPDTSSTKDSKLKTLIHECTHYIDTFDSADAMYGSGTGLSIWAQRMPDRTVNNADNIACYIAN